MLQHKYHSKIDELHSFNTFKSHKIKIDKNYILNEMKLYNIKKQIKNQNRLAKNKNLNNHFIYTEYITLF